jgi:formamidopyrimidine-DNA glycosylase
VIGVELHPDKRIFRDADVASLARHLSGTKMTGSQARGKQMVFRFAHGSWLAIHLGMTGKLRAEPPDFAAGKHDHLVLRQKKRALVFSDPRQFGRVLFFHGKGEPGWWSKLPPALTSRKFTPHVLRAILHRHRKLAIKPALLLQDHFPGVGNWMADEILWHARIHPRIPGGRFNSERVEVLWESIRAVCAGALKHVGKDFSDPPRGWLFHERWSRDGKCPRDETMLKRETIGGRTTAWCPKCQRL